MKRPYACIRVCDIESNVSFYSTLFGAAPTLRKTHYSQWVLDGSSMAITTSGHGLAPGFE